MQSIDWSNSAPGESAFRTDKEIRFAATRSFAEYPAVLTISGVSVDDEAEQLAELIVLLKTQGTISDYNEVAILLHSTKPFLSAAYVAALKKRGISAYYPRSRQYFEQKEVCLIVGCFVYLLGYRLNTIVGNDERDDFPDYLVGCFKKLKQECSRFQALLIELRTITSEIASATEQSTGNGLADYFYRLVFTAPFAGFLDDKKKRQRQNLPAAFSVLSRIQL